MLTSYPISSNDAGPLFFKTIIFFFLFVVNNFKTFSSLGTVLVFFSFHDKIVQVYINWNIFVVSYIIKDEI